MLHVKDLTKDVPPVEVNSLLRSARRHEDSHEWLLHPPRQCRLVLNTTSTQ
jgi:hypothetical protein